MHEKNRWRKSQHRRKAMPEWETVPQTKTSVFLKYTPQNWALLWLRLAIVDKQVFLHILQHLDHRIEICRHWDGRWKRMTMVCSSRRGGTLGSEFCSSPEDERARRRSLDTTSSILRYISFGNMDIGVADRKHASRMLVYTYSTVQ